MSLWTSQEIVEATSGQCKNDFEVSGLSIDTRTLEKGDLFVALMGENDGHVYLNDAYKKGAAGALVSVDADGPCVLVTDTLKALESMGAYARNRAQNAKRIAVTGSVGKTGTKEMLKLVLSDQGQTTASAASYNNHWGVPLTLARMPKETDYGVFEIGMNHPGEIRPLTKMVAPHVAIITTVAESHAAFFDSLEEIADAKSEIFEGVVPGGAAIINRDHHLYLQMLNLAKRQKIQNIYSFGQHKEANCRLESVTLEELQSQVKIVLFGKTVSYVVPIPGMHWVINSLAVLLAVYLVGADFERAAQSLMKMAPPKGRGTRHEIQTSFGKIILIDESYNANPESMRAAISVLGATQPLAGGRRIAVVGDMRELGDIADDRHAALAEPLLAANVDLVYCCGQHMKKLAEQVPEEMLALHADISAELIQPLLSDLHEGDVIMIKGSNGTRMAPIVEAILKLNQTGLKATG